MANEKDDWKAERREALAEMRNSPLWKQVLKPSLEGRLAEIGRRAMMGRTLPEMEIRRAQHHYELLTAMLEDPIKWFLGVGE